MGQGRLLVSPLQMALVAAAVVNEGVIMRPRLVQADPVLAIGHRGYKAPGLAAALRPEVAAML